MKIGIIGSTGFIGSNLKKNFSSLSKNKYKVFSFSSFKKTSSEWISRICNEIRYNKPDIIINCAADQNLHNDKKAIINLINSNLTASSLFLNQAVKNNNFKGFICFGTKWEFDENRKFNPLNLYAATKHANDSLLKYFSIKYNFAAISLKIFDIYGNDNKSQTILNLLLKSYKKKKILKISPGNQYLDYVHIDELHELITMICNDITKNKLNGFETFTVSSKKPIKLKSLIRKLDYKLKYPLKVKIGAKKYRENEAMKPIKKIYNYPGWKSKLNLIKELEKIFDGQI